MIANNIAQVRQGTSGVGPDTVQAVCFNSIPPTPPPPPFPWTPLAQQAVDALRGDLLPCALQIPVSIEKGLQLDKSSLAWFTQAENQCNLDATKQGIVSSHYRKTHHDQQQI